MGAARRGPAAAAAAATASERGPCSRAPERSPQPRPPLLTPPPAPGPLQQQQQPAGSAAAGSLVNQQDLSFLSDKTMGLGKVLKLRHHPKGCLEIRGEAFVIITTEGCF